MKVIVTSSIFIPASWDHPKMFVHIIALRGLSISILCFTCLKKYYFTNREGWLNGSGFGCIS